MEQLSSSKSLFTARCKYCNRVKTHLNKMIRIFVKKKIIFTGNTINNVEDLKIRRKFSVEHYKYRKKVIPHTFLNDAKYLKKVISHTFLNDAII